MAKWEYLWIPMYQLNQKPYIRLTLFRPDYLTLHTGVVAWYSWGCNSRNSCGFKEMWIATYGSFLYVPWEWLGGPSSALLCCLMSNAATLRKERYERAWSTKKSRAQPERAISSCSFSLLFIISNFINGASDWKGYLQEYWRKDIMSLSCNSSLLCSSILL